MQEIGQYLLSGKNIYQGKFANTQQCVLKSDKTIPFSFKLISGDSQALELKLIRFLNHIKRDNQVYKIRNFPDEFGRPNEKIILNFLLPSQGGVVFILPLATESLRKSIQKNSLYLPNEFDALNILNQVMMSYKTFYSLQIPYKVLNPGNILKYHKDYVLIPPTTLLYKPEVINANSTLNDYDYLYTAPEILKMYSIDKLGVVEDTKFEVFNDFYSKGPEIYCTEDYQNRFETTIHKQDIWSMGVILFKLLFGVFPFQHKDSEVGKTQNESFLKSNWSNIKKYEECNFRWYWYYKHIMINDLHFPIKTMIQEDIIDLLQQMLQKDPVKRISYNEMKNHPFMKYYMTMQKKKLKGVAHRRGNVMFKEYKIINEKDARQEFKVELKNKLKPEIKKNKERRKTIYEKHKKSKLEHKKEHMEESVYTVKKEKNGGSTINSSFKKKNEKTEYVIIVQPKNDYNIDSKSKHGIIYIFFIVL